MAQAEIITSPNSLPPFKFQDKPIRTELDGDIIWFVARDVCDALGIQWNGRALSSIPAEWTRVRKFLNLQGIQPLKAITEPAVYKLAFRSNKPEADTFTNWIASEVMPSIRKTGKYEVVATPATLTPSLRAELKALVDSKLSTHPAAVQGKARSEIWSRFNRHFKIAEYAQLPAKLMPEAREYLIGMEVKALKALPTPAGAIAGRELVPALPDDEFFSERAAQCVRAARLALQEAFEELSGLSRAYQRKYLHQPGKAGICFQSCSAFNEQWQCAIGALNAALFTVRAMRSVDEI